MFSVKHLFCGNVKAITCIVDEVLVEEIVQAASAFDDFEDRNEEEKEEEEDEPIEDDVVESHKPKYSNMGRSCMWMRD